jgi:hypothetical protein
MDLTGSWAMNWRAIQAGTHALEENLQFVRQPV